MEPAGLKPGQFIAVSPMRQKPRAKKENAIIDFYTKVLHRKEDNEWNDYFEDLKIDTHDFKQACQDHYVFDCNFHRNQVDASVGDDHRNKLEKIYHSIDR